MGDHDQPRHRVVPVEPAPALLGLVVRLPTAQRFMYNLFAQTWISYRNRTHKSLPAPGDRAPQAPLTEGPNAGRTLYDLIREPDHHVLVFQGDHTTAELTERLSALHALIREHRLTAHVHTIQAGNREAHRPRAHHPGRKPGGAPRL